MTTYTKAITFSYPSSANAQTLGFLGTGCWHISRTALDIEGSGQVETFMPHNAEGFATPDHPDLIAMYHETEGKICPSFREHGNSLALEAIAATA